MKNMNLWSISSIRVSQLSEGTMDISSFFSIYIIKKLWTTKVQFFSAAAECLKWENSTFFAFFHNKLNLSLVLRNVKIISDCVLYENLTLKCFETFGFSFHRKFFCFTICTQNWNSGYFFCWVENILICSLENSNYSQQNINTFIKIVQKKESLLLLISSMLCERLSHFVSLQQKIDSLLNVTANRIISSKKIIFMIAQFVIKSDRWIHNNWDYHFFSSHYHYCYKKQQTSCKLPWIQLNVAREAAKVSVESTSPVPSADVYELSKRISKHLTEKRVFN